MAGQDRRRERLRKALIVVMGSSEDQEFISALKESVESLGVSPLTGSQIQQMAVHYRMLTKWNRRLNLTRITTAEAAARLHYAESIYGCSFLKGATSLLDVGSGAGFPAAPLAIMRPELSVTALESSQKKSVFLKEVKQELGLPNLEIKTARVEDVDWSGYSAVTSRALEHAEKMYAELIRNLKLGQTLMLFCSDSLLEVLNSDLASEIKVQPHRIPHSRSRLIAAFECR
jgi:16S rRNA (guanine527-N7)-methyltransferase